MTKFRFQDRKIRQESIAIGDILFDMADNLKEKKLYRFAEQLRGAGMHFVLCDILRSPKITL